MPAVIYSADYYYTTVKDAPGKDADFLNCWLPRKLTSWPSTPFRWGRTARSW